MPILRTAIQIGSDQQTGATRRHAPQEDVCEHNASLITAGGIALALAVIADGEGESGARLAAELGARTVLERVKRSHDRSVRSILRDAVEAANKAVRREKELNPGMTQAHAAMTVAAIYKDRLYLAHLGNTSAYLVRNGRKESQLFQLTTSHGKRHHLEAAVGLSESIRPDQDIRSPDGGFVSELQLQRGDHIILCTDGLVGDSPGEEPRYIKRGEITEAMREKGVVEAAKRLTSFPMARNVDDNVAAIVIRVPGGTSQSRPLLALAAAAAGIATVILVGLALVAVVNAVQPEPTPTAIVYQDSGQVVIDQIAEGVVLARASPDDVEITLRPGMTVHAGSIVRSEANAVRLLVLNTGVRILLEQPDTEVALEQLMLSGSPEEGHLILDLRSGQLRVRHQGAEQITVQTSGNVVAELANGRPGELAMSTRDGAALIECVAGNCSAIAGGGLEPLQEGWRRSLSAGGEAQDAPIESTDVPLELRPTPTPSPTPEAVGNMAVVVVQGAGLRFSPVMSSRVIVTISQGETLEILEPPLVTDVVRYHVRDSAGNEGWVDSKQIATVTPPAP